MRINPKVFSIVMLVVFITTALFGFAIMNHTAHASPADCAISLISIVVCPQQSGALSMALHHLGAYQSFSSASHISPLLTLLLIALAGVFLILHAFSHIPQSLRHVVVCSRSDSSTYAYALAQQGECQWLSHLNNSPSFA